MYKLTQARGINLISTHLERLEEGSGKPVKFLTRGRGVDRYGEPVYNEFTLLSINPTKSNVAWTAVTAAYGNSTVELHLSHTHLYSVPAQQ